VLTKAYCALYERNLKKRKRRDIMKKVFVLAWGSFLLVSLTAAFSQNAQSDSPKTGTLRVLIDGFSNDKGKARIALCNSLESYKNADKAFRLDAAPIRNGKAEWVLQDVPFGEYAIRVFHDENGNKILDKNLFGKPTEAYGFSNNARATFGAPDYKKAAFQFDNTDMTVRITVQ
jgi:uncharacterized protein (DUF2141 family)